MKTLAFADRSVFAVAARWGAVAALLCGLLAAPGGPARAGDAERVLDGFELSPVPLDLRGKSRWLVGLGSYIVNAQAGCSDCHTAPSYAPGGDPFAGEPELINAARYLAGGRAFGPLIVSPNLTPDAEGRPAGLSWPEFRELLRTGRDPDEAGRLLQIMPWPVYGKMSDRDLRAVYEFLRAVPSLPSDPSPAP